MAAFIELVVFVVFFYKFFAWCNRGFTRKDGLIRISQAEADRYDDERRKRVRLWTDPDLEERVRAEVEEAARNPAKYKEIWERIEEYYRVCGSLEVKSGEHRGWHRWEEENNTRLRMYYGKEVSLKNIHITRTLLMNTYGKLTLRSAALFGYENYLPHKYDNIDRAMAELFKPKGWWHDRVQQDPADRDSPYYKMWWREPLTESEKELRNISRVLSLEGAQELGDVVPVEEVIARADRFYAAEKKAKEEAERLKQEAARQARMETKRAR